MLLFGADGIVKYSTIKLIKVIIAGSLLCLSFANVNADEWSIGIFTGTSPFNVSDPISINNPVLTKEDVTDVPASFVADPFLFVDNSQYFMFFEILNQNTNEGDIGYATSTDGIDWQYQQVVLDENFHLSYPYVFRANGQIYMIPETYQANSVRLYQATNFPTEWTFVSTLLDGQQLVDNSIFFDNDTWWMYSSTPSNNVLYLHYADNLEGPWTEHPSSPVVVDDPNIARPGGRVINYNGSIYRFAQDDLPVYGESVRAFEITELTRTTYAEIEIIESPILLIEGTDWRSLGIHQIDPLEVSPGQWLAVVDGYGNPVITPPAPSDPPAGNLLNSTLWSLVSTDSQELFGEDGSALNAFDGNPNTVWHTEWLNSSPTHPHEIQIDLGSLYDVTGINYLPRQDGGTNGRIGNFEIYVSSDGVNWGGPVTTGSFENIATLQTIAFAATPGQFVRLRALSDPNGSPWTSVAEFGVYGSTFSGNLPPSSSIVEPATAVSILVGDSVNFSGSATDPESDFPLTYNWNFGAGSGLSNSVLQNPGLVTYNVAGTYTVSLSVTDSLGNTSNATTVEVTVLDGSVLPLDKSLWSLTYVDSEETIGENGAALNAFDNNPNTIWHTEWLLNAPTHPHEIQLNLGGLYDISGISYLPRQDGGGNGRIGDYEIRVSADGVTWGTPVASGTFANSASNKNINFPSTPGQYISLRSLTDPNGSIWTAVAEIDVFGQAYSGNLPPDSIIDLPASNAMTIVSGESIEFSGQGSDSENDVPFSYLWNFGTDSGIPDSYSASPGLVTFNAPGIYNVTFTVTDGLGNEDNTPAVVEVTVLDASAPIALDKSLWNLLYVDSQEIDGENGAATNVFDGDLNTIWHTAWSSGSPAHPHEIQIDTGSVQNIVGFTYTPRQDGGVNGRISTYEIYVSSDGVTWGVPVTSGTFTNNASSQQVSFPTNIGRYLRFRTLSEVNGNPWAAVSEIDIFREQ